MQISRLKCCHGRQLLSAVCVALLTGLASSASGIILLGTGDPAANTTAPTGALADSGWQYEGTWGGFLGTPIAPHFFVSAGHIGQAGSAFVYQGVSYTPVKSYPDPNSDLLIWQVAETFPTYALLYARPDEVGKHLVAIGRGTQRGTEIRVNNVLRGWMWGGGDGVQRWGENDVSAIAVAALGNEYVQAAFDRSGSANEATFSVGDSGGAVFIKDGAAWKLAGINYGVDGPFFTDSAGNGGFFGALTDARGYYYQSGSNYLPIGGSATVPVSLYSTRISSKLAWVYSVIDPAGDVSGNGVSNLAKYAFNLDPLAASAAGTPTLTRAGDSLTLTYTKSTLATDLTYAVEQSTDLVTWTAITAQSQSTTLSATAQSVSTTISANGASCLFLRVRVTRP